MFVLLTTVAMVAAAPMSVTGYVVDNYCWDKDNHIGIDGVNLELQPEKHILHCLLVAPCKVNSTQKATINVSVLAQTRQYSGEWVCLLDGRLRREIHAIVQAGRDRER